MNTNKGIIGASIKDYLFASLRQEDMAPSLNISTKERLLIIASANFDVNSMINISCDLSRSDVSLLVQEKDVTELVSGIRHDKELTLKFLTQGLPPITQTYNILTYAVTIGDVQYVRSILPFVTDINYHTDQRYYRTPLSAAAIARDEVITKILLEHGADPNIRCNGVSAFHIAIMTNGTGIIKDMIEHGANTEVPYITPSGKVYKLRKLPSLKKEVRDYLIMRHYSTKLISSITDADKKKALVNILTPEDISS